MDNFNSKKLFAVVFGSALIVGSHFLGLTLTVEEIVAIVAMVLGQNVVQGLADIFKIVNKVTDESIKTKTEVKPQ